jgi:hypothetical protein
VNDPADGKVIVNLPPGLIDPEFHDGPVDVWAVLSLFVQVTLPPTATVTGLGENAVVVSVDAPPTIDTGVPLPPVLGVVGVDEYDDPQPAQMTSAAAASVKRKE